MNMNNMLKNSIVFAVILLFLLVGIYPISAIESIKESNPLISDGNTLYVGGSGQGNYTYIQDAVDNTSDGDTVYVYDEGSPYYENVIVHKSINLIGENRNTTVINGIDQYRSTISLSYLTSDVLVSGFTLTHNYSGGWGCNGISIRGNKNIIQDNKITFNEYGIYLYDDTYQNVITNNIIVHNSHVGIFDDCMDSTNIVKWNVIGGNGDADFKEGGIYKHRSGGIYHHNDFDLNWGYNAFTEFSFQGRWDDNSEGNFWDNWESNPGYPDCYIIRGTQVDQKDRYPSATRYFNFPIVRIDKSSYKADPGESISFDTYLSVPSSSVSWFWEFGDGTTSNEKKPVHSYSKSGIYRLNVTVTDNKEVSDTDKSTAYIGIPPDKPTITGPTKGRPKVWYEYSIVATDTDSDYISYYIDWEDPYIDEIGPYPAGEVVKIGHS